MIAGIGIDLCQIARFEAMLHRRPGVLTKLFDIEAITDNTGRQLPVESLAARFAAKEALAKAIGITAGLQWTDVEVDSYQEQPVFRLSETAAKKLAQFKITKIHLSLSHDAGIAAAFVVCEREP